MRSKKKSQYESLTDSYLCGSNQPDNFFKKLLLFKDTSRSRLKVIKQPTGQVMRFNLRHILSTSQPEQRRHRSGF